MVNTSRRPLREGIRVFIMGYMLQVFSSFKVNLFYGENLLAYADMLHASCYSVVTKLFFHIRQLSSQDMSAYV